MFCCFILCSITPFDVSYSYLLFCLFYFILFLLCKEVLFLCRIFDEYFCYTLIIGLLHLNLQLSKDSNK